MKLSLRQKLLLIIAIVSIAILAFCLLDTKKDTEPVFLKADQGPIRVKPEKGSDVASKDYNPIFDHIKIHKYNTSSVNLQPNPEKPIEIQKKDHITELILGEIRHNQVLENVSNPKKTLEIILSDKPSITRKIARKDKKGFFAQVGSERSRNDAEKEFSRLLRNHSKLLTGLDHQVVKFDIVNKGRYYRLMIGPLNSPAHAQLICKKLIDSGKNCIIKKV